MTQPGKDFYIKSNRFISLARYDLNIWEQRVLSYILMDIVNRYSCTSKGVCEVKYIDISELANLKGRNNAHVKKALDSLRTKGVYIKNKYIRWFDLFEYCDFPGNDVCCDIRISRELSPYIFSNKDFTKCKIYGILNFKNKYSIKMHEIIQMGIGKTYSPGTNEGKTPAVYHEFSIDIVHLRNILCLRDKYITYRDLKNAVLIPVMKDFERVYNIGLIGYKFKLHDNKSNRIVTHITIQTEGYMDNECRITDDKKYKKEVRLSDKSYR